jgi:hypothetical protein
VAWFDGLTWKGMGLIATLCLINAARRTSRDLDLGPRLNGAFVFLVDWSVKTAQATASGLLVAIPVALAVVITYNLAPRRASVRYPTIAIAIAASCVVGVALMMAGRARRLDCLCGARIPPRSRDRGGSALCPALCAGRSGFHLPSRRG